MIEKNSKSMTASELLREADSSPCSMCHLVMTGDESCATTGCASWAHRLADRIDAELAQARELSLLQGAAIWAKANGWPEFREGEGFGEWLERCTLKRPAPEALGADGLPVVEGETVWDTESGKELSVCAIANAAAGMIQCSDDTGYCEDYDARNLTHTPPDSQERIDEEALEDFSDYWNCGDAPCSCCPVKDSDGMTPEQRYNAPCCKDAQTLDLLRRQRELDKRTGGE